MKKVKGVRNAKKARMRRASRRSGRNMAEIQREAMEIPFVKALSAKDPGLGRILRHHYALGTRSVD